MAGMILIDGVIVPIGSHCGKGVIMGSDHRGFAYKSRMAAMLQEEGYRIRDIGTYSAERCDYPAISDRIGRLVSESGCGAVGVGICGSGIGILIPASKHRGIYVARCLTPDDAITSRRHNNTNVLGIGADRMEFETALETVRAWLQAPFFESPDDKAYLDRYVQTAKLEKAAFPSN